MSLPELPNKRPVSAQHKLSQKLAMLYIESRANQSPTEFVDRYLQIEKEIDQRLKELNAQ